MGLLVMGRKPAEHLFWHLWLVNYAVLAYYFANRSKGGESVATAHPLRLPRGTVRWSLILMFVGSAIYLGQGWFQAPHKVWDDPAFFPMLSLAGFFVGRIFRAILHSKQSTEAPAEPGGFKRRLLDAKALLSLSTALVLVVTLLLQVDLPAQTELQRFCFVYIIFYFGSRD